MTTYYLDATNGNDGDTGLVGHAWKTISKINGFGFAAGDICLLKRGETWRELWSVNTGGAAGNPITYGAYGTGATPRITGCDLLTGWTLQAGNVYQASYIESIDTYILLEDGEHLTRVANLAAVNSAGKFFPDNANNLIYAWCTDGADPDTHVKEIGARYDAVDCRDREYISFEDLHFHGAGGQFGSGFRCSPTWFTPNHIILNKCEVDHCYFEGISFNHQDTFSPLNVIQLNGCVVHHNLTFGVRIEGEDAAHLFTNVLVNGCSIYSNGNATFGQFGCWLRACDAPIVTRNEIYDNDGNLDWSDNLLFGITPDLVVSYNVIHGGNHSGVHMDVGSYGLIHHNVIYDCTWNGIWIEEHRTGVGDATTIAHNTCYHNLHGLVFGPGSTIREVSGVTCKNNIFAFNRRANVELNEDGVAPDYLNNDLDYNCYQTDPTDPLYEGEFRAENPRVNKTFAQWKTYTSWDANSFNVDPLMLNPAIAIFKLRPTSPCRDSGVLLAGVDQVVKGRGPDMGRYELQFQSLNRIRLGFRMRSL